MADVAQAEAAIGRRAFESDEQDDLPVVLELRIDDPETIQALNAFPQGPARDEYALAALKIGVLALRHAGQQLDSQTIQREGTRILESLESQLDKHSQHVHERLTRELQGYFDPQSGRFQERVHRLIKQDGELEQVLRRQIGDEDSQLSRTLLAHLGEHSPLMKMLSPDESQGLLAALRGEVDRQLGAQREQLLKQFSLDNKEGALARLVEELNGSHGRLNKDLQGKIDVVIKEFSLDEENSALCRLVHNVDSAQKKIRDEFSLDNKTSALARLKDELLTIFGAHIKANADFQEEVKVALAKISATREAAERSTRHGDDFESAVCEFVIREAQQTGDVAEPTGNVVGRIKNCKVGDCVVQLGPDSPAVGARIVLEAKEATGYTLAAAREEIKQARDNRGAQMGIFVFSRKSTPQGLAPFARYGEDVVVTWDAEDATTDVYLKAGLMTARALCIRSGRSSEAQAGDFEAIEKAILQIEKRSAGLEDVTKWAQTIQNNSDKILDRIKQSRRTLDTELETLREKVADLKNSVEESGEE